MQIPFNSNDVRFVSIDGNTVRFELENGHIEITFESAEIMHRVLSRKAAASGRRHEMYQDGIFGL